MSTYSRYYEQILNAKEFPFDLKYVGDVLKITLNLRHWNKRKGYPYIIKQRNFRITINLNKGV